MILKRRMKYKVYLTLFQSNNKRRNKKEKLAMNIKDKNKCSLRKKPCSVLHIK